MNSYHISLHPKPTTEMSIEWHSLDWQGQTLTTAQVAPQLIAQIHFPVAFDDLVSRLNGLPGGYAEGDGAFGIVGPEGIWKLTGTFYESHPPGGIGHLEMLGTGSAEPLQTLIECLGVEPEDCLVQWMQGGFFTTVEQWRLATQSDRQP